MTTIRNQNLNWLTGANPCPHIRSEASKTFQPVGSCRIMVNNVADGTTEEEIEALFSQYTTVHNTYKPTNARIAFVTVPDDEAEKVMTLDEDSLLLNGNNIRLDYSVPKMFSNQFPRQKRCDNTSKLYVYGIDEEATEEALQRRFACIANVPEVFINPKYKKANGMTGFVNIDSRMAQIAVNIFAGIPFYGKNIGVKFSTSTKEMEGNHTGFYGQPVQQQPPPQQQQQGYVPQQQGYVANNGNFTQPQEYGTNPALGRCIPTLNGNMPENANKPRAPMNQQEVDAVIKEREMIEQLHPFEKYLIETLPENSMNMPPQTAPASYYALLRDRAACKVKLLLASQAGFNITGAAPAPPADKLSRYGFNMTNTANGNDGPSPNKQPRW